MGVTYKSNILRVFQVIYTLSLFFAKILLTSIYLSKSKISASVAGFTILFIRYLSPFDVPGMEPTLTAWHA